MCPPLRDRSHLRESGARPVRFVHMQDCCSNRTAIMTETSASNQRIRKIRSEQGAKGAQDVLAGYSHATWDCAVRLTTRAREVSIPKRSISR